MHQRLLDKGVAPAKARLAVNWVDMAGFRARGHGLPRFARNDESCSQREAESTLTERYQTTVPETVRRALRLSKRDKIRFTIGPAAVDAGLVQRIQFLVGDLKVDLDAALSAEDE